MREELDDLSLEKLELVEHELFSIVDQAVSSRRGDLPPCGVGDSFAIRAYLPWRRSFGDIDFVFASDVNPRSILAFAEGCPGSGTVIVGEGSDGRFIRAKYIVPSLERLGSDFRIDFHIGGIWHRGQLFGVDHSFVESAQWSEVPSVDGGSTVSLPIPSLEELLILKLIKFIGGDQADVLSILAAPKLNLECVAGRLAQRGEAAAALANLKPVKTNLPSMLESWSGRYGRDLPQGNLPLLRSRVAELELSLSNV
jgi:hypothetical protein